MVTFTRLTNQRLKTNRQEHFQTRKKVCLPSSCHHAAASFYPLVFFFSPFSFFSVPLFLFFSFLHVPFCDFPQSIWLMLTLLITYVLPLIDPAPGTNPCGKIATTSVDVNTAIHGMMYHRYVDPGKFSLSSILKQFVHSWQEFMVMSWIQPHANPYLLLVEWKNSLCSPTMSWSTHITWKHSRWTTCYTTSASTSCTLGIAILNLHPWISVGKIRPGTPSFSEMSTAWLTFFMKFVLIGLKVKNLGSCFRTIFGHSLPRISHISCAWVAMRHFPTVTCSHKSCGKNVRPASCSTRSTLNRVTSWHVLFTTAFAPYLFTCLLILSSWLQFLIWLKEILSLPVLTLLVHQRACNVARAISTGNPVAVLHPQVTDRNQVPPWAHCPKIPNMRRTIVTVTLMLTTTGIRQCLRSSTWWIYQPSPWRSLPTPGGDRTTTPSSPHSHLQRGHISSPDRRQSPYGDRSGSFRCSTKPSTGVLLQRNCWSHSCRPPRLGHAVGNNLPN